MSSSYLPHDSVLGEVVRPYSGVLSAFSSKISYVCYTCGFKMFDIYRRVEYTEHDTKIMHSWGCDNCGRVVKSTVVGEQRVMGGTGTISQKNSL